MSGPGRGAKKVAKRRRVRQDQRQAETESPVMEHPMEVSETSLEQDMQRARALEYDDQPVNAPVEAS